MNTPRSFDSPVVQGNGAGTGTRTGRKRIHLGISAPELYSEYGSGSGYKEMKKTTQKKLTTSFMISFPVDIGIGIGIRRYRYRYKYRHIYICINVFTVYCIIIFLSIFTHIRL
jgi:hypothetical protein